MWLTKPVYLVDSYSVYMHVAEMCMCWGLNMGIFTALLGLDTLAAMLGKASHCITTKLVIFKHNQIVEKVTMTHLE